MRKSHDKPYAPGRLVYFVRTSISVRKIIFFFRNNNVSRVKIRYFTLWDQWSMCKIITTYTICLVRVAIWLRLSSIDSLL